LSLGADDYVSKPFSIAQLVLRVNAVLRRTRVAAELEHRFELGGDLAIDTRNLQGLRDGAILTFTRREMDVLQYLRVHHERPVGREELLQKVWGYTNPLQIETRTVDIHIAKLRRKIEKDPGSPQILLTVRGAGYRLVCA
jgi:two-component system response regulator RegX3